MANRLTVKKLFGHILYFTISTCLLLITPINVTAQWNGTADTAWYNTTNTTFTISTAEQLAGLAKIIQDGVDYFSGKTINLTADIDVSPNEWVAIGSFMGTFDGNNHKIICDEILFSRLSAGGILQNIILDNPVSATDFTNLALVNGNEGEIHNCRAIITAGGIINLLRSNRGVITDTYITCDNGSIGLQYGLVRYNNEEGSIYNCYSTCYVSESNAEAGGLVGQNSGSITNSYASGAVTHGNPMGGLVGDNKLKGNISNSYAIGAVTGGGDIGGLVGLNQGLITSSYATGAVTGEWGNIGGLVGRNGEELATGEIVKCYATGNVTGKNAGNVGGLAGRNDYLITNSYAKGNATGGNEANVGGLMGLSGQDGAYGNSFVSNCYATGAVTGGDFANVGGLTGKHSSGGDGFTNGYATGAVTGGVSANVGGFVGYKSNLLLYLYWNIDASQLVDGVQQIPKRGIGDNPDSDTNGKLEADMKNQAFVDLLNNYVEDHDNLTPWTRDTRGTNGGFPILDFATTTTSSVPNGSSTTTSRRLDDDCPLENIYGSDSEEVQLLRYFRNGVLRNTPEGRELIKIYYQWSPIITKAMDDDKEFKEWIKEIIEDIMPLVEKSVE